MTAACAEGATAASPAEMLALDKLPAWYLAKALPALLPEPTAETVTAACAEEATAAAPAETLALGKLPARLLAKALPALLLEPTAETVTGAGALMLPAPAATVTESGAGQTTAKPASSSSRKSSNAAASSGVKAVSTHAGLSVEAPAFGTLAFRPQGCREEELPEKAAARIAAPSAKQASGKAFLLRRLGRDLVCRFARLRVAVPSRWILPVVPSDITGSRLPCCADAVTDPCFSWIRRRTATQRG